MINRFKNKAAPAPAPVQEQPVEQGEIALADAQQFWLDLYDAVSYALDNLDDLVPDPESAEVITEPAKDSGEAFVASVQALIGRCTAHARTGPVEQVMHAQPVQQSQPQQVPVYAQSQAQPVQQMQPQQPRSSRPQGW